MMITFLLGLLPFIMVLGNSMLIPILPDLEQSLQLSPTETSFILTAFNIPAAFVIPFVGFFSDRYGRKTVILFSLVLIFLGGFICFISGFIRYDLHAFHWLLIGRSLQGIGTGGTTPLAMALVGDLYSGEKRARQLAILEVFNGLGKVLAPIIGAMLALISWYFPFIVFPILSLFLMMTIMFRIQHRKSGVDVMTFSMYKKRMKQVFNKERKRLAGAYFFGGVGLFLVFGMLYYLSYRIEEIFRIDGFFKGFTFFFPLGALTISSFWTGKRLKGEKGSGMNFLIVGSSVMLISYFFLLFSHAFSWLICFLTIGFGGLGFVLPTLNLLITSSVGDHERGGVVAFYGVARFVGVALGPIVFSFFLYETAFLFTGSFVLLSLSIGVMLWSQMGRASTIKSM